MDHNVTAEGLSILTNLETLTVHSPILRNKRGLRLPNRLFPGLSALTNLTELSLMERISDRENLSGSSCNESFISNLTNLRSLYIEQPPDVTLLPNLTSLDIFSTKKVPFTNITRLRVHCQSDLSDRSLRRLRNLTALSLHMTFSAEKVTDKSVSRLTNLTALRLTAHITMKSLSALPKLVKINLGSANNQIPDFSQLTGITHLNASSAILMEHHIAPLRNLKVLKGYFMAVTSPSLPETLEHLTLSYIRDGDYAVTYISHLTNLTALHVSSEFVVNEGFSQLTKLRALEICRNRNLLAEDIIQLKNLSELILRYQTEEFPDWCVDHLPKLIRLSRPDGHKTTRNKFDKIIEIPQTNLHGVTRFKFLKPGRDVNSLHQ